MAGVLGLSGLVVGVFALVENNKAKALLEKSGVDEKTIKTLEEKVLKAVATAEENIEKLRTKQASFTSVAEALQSILDQNPDIIRTDENLANIATFLQVESNRQESLQKLQETTERLKNSSERLKNDPPTY